MKAALHEKVGLPLAHPRNRRLGCGMAVRHIQNLETFQRKLCRLRSGFDARTGANQNRFDERGITSLNGSLYRLDTTGMGHSNPQRTSCPGRLKEGLEAIGHEDG
jgi:hypothetical protein